MPVVLRVNGYRIIPEVEEVRWPAEYHSQQADPPVEFLDDKNILTRTQSEPAIASERGERT